LGSDAKSVGQNDYYPKEMNIRVYFYFVCFEFQLIKFLIYFFVFLNNVARDYFSNPLRNPPAGGRGGRGISRQNVTPYTHDRGLHIAARPDPPLNCTSGERTLFSVRVRCSQGFDGGVAQRFALEAYDDLAGPAAAADGSASSSSSSSSSSSPMLANMTADRPDFTLRSLSPSAGLRLAVYAYNSRGTSERAWLTAYTLNSADKQTTSGT